MLHKNSSSFNTIDFVWLIGSWEVVIFEEDNGNLTFISARYEVERLVIKFGTEKAVQISENS
jgi:hypothetical protein